MCISKKSGTSSAKISKSFVATTFCIDSASLVQTLLTPPERLRRSFTASSVCKFPFKVTLIVTRFLYFQGYVKWVKNDYSIEALCHQEKCLGFHNDHLYKRIPMTHSSFFFGQVVIFCHCCFSMILSWPVFNSSLELLLINLYTFCCTKERKCYVPKTNSCMKN